MQDTYTTKKTLLNRLKDPSDQIAWETFMKVYWPVINAWARQIGCNEATAQDVFQETVISLLRIMPSFNYDRNSGKFRSFLKTIVIRRASDIWNRERKLTLAGDLGADSAEGDFIFDQFATADSIDQEDHVWLEGVLTAALENARRKVDPVTYESFLLSTIEQIQMDDILEQLPEVGNRNAVYQHKARFLDILKREFRILLEQSEDANAASCPGDEKAFKKALESVVSMGRAFRKTMALSQLPAEVNDRLASVRDKVCLIPNNVSGNFICVPDFSGSPLWHRINEGESRIGRGHGNEIVIIGDGISRVHAKIVVGDSGCVLIDNRSTNGTSVNGQKITERELKSGDEIEICGRSLFYLYAGAHSD